MSWHPYDKKKRTWTIYWDVRSPKNSASYEGDPAGDWDILEFELTDPDVLDRDDWRSLQLWLLEHFTPPGYTLNISHLWGRNWPNDASFRFGRITDLHRVPLLLTGDGNRKTQPSKRQDYYWVLVQTPPDQEKLKDIIFFHSIDLEDITWITDKPLAPFPDQMFLHNDTVLAWNAKQLGTLELDEIVRRETWALTMSRFGHMHWLLVRNRLNNEAIWDILRQGAAEYNLEIESTSFDKRPAKPSILKGCLTAPLGAVGLVWEQLKNKERKRGQ